MPYRWVNRRVLNTFGWRKAASSLSLRKQRIPYSYHGLHTIPYRAAEITPLRKELKDATKIAKQSKSSQIIEESDRAKLNTAAEWELTVGIEIHAQLNTGSKLFSFAETDNNDQPNTTVEPFDIAVPGSQPIFQVPVLIPAIRAALALNCTVQPESKFDRKHYFYHDQPSGYQITQYYQPFAVNGGVSITASDGLPPADGDVVEVGIKQIQLEQDTARTQEQDREISMIDFNRSGHALIEIISLPHLHSPEAAAAYMRKVQGMLFAVDAVTTGMELGGLRADVNVSVRRKDDVTASHSYSGVSGLGQRTEIKNLSSFKAVEDAIRAERDRQISVLEAGGVVEGETRGWSLSAPHETRRLRGKEGEVDYRYMPDPDIPPVYIDQDLIHHFQQTLPPVPEQLVDMLVKDYGMSKVDAKALLALDDGQRLVYFQEVVEILAKEQDTPQQEWGRIAGNWILHELGALLTISDTTWDSSVVPAQSMAEIIQMQARKEVTSISARKLLKIVFEGAWIPIRDIATKEGLLFNVMTEDEYRALIRGVMEDHPQVVTDIRQKQKHGKVKFLLGQMLQTGDRNRMEAVKAESLLKEELGI